ncbi:ABC transporter permease [Ancylobacter sonchi]|nr:ABC transporter permease [Ancylobacter sonchi]
MTAILDHQDAGPQDTGTRRSLMKRVLDGLSPSRLMVPGFLLFWSLLVIVPLVVIVLFSFLQVRQFRVVYEPTLATWISLIDSGRWMAVVRTLRVALTMTVIEFLLAFPFALWLAKGCRSKTVKAAVITLLTIPFFLDAASRIIVWRSILGTTGAINTALMSLGLVDQPVEWLLYSEFAVHFGLLGTYFPPMVFPIFMSIALIDDEFIQASGDLGASPAQTLFNVILPLALPGIVAGIVFTLVPLMAAFVEPQLLGGGFVDLLGNSVNSALQQLKYPTAAALSTLVVLLLGLCLVALIRVVHRRIDLAAMFVAMRR